ncbi:hypothetical protein [Lewinella sp. IMCC34183]|uniref:hypothetical protein n=1 Tax=Lewinella sp. IMCC34183 TaxID=2248762 RepID=UPI000E26BC47|nr:hypothetical protein [Lewinella sp. IMCC34183]
MAYRYLAEIIDLQTLTLLKLSLDRAGIPYRVHFEQALQAGAYLTGNRGAQVEVRADDFAPAAALLEELGVAVDTRPRDDTFSFLHEFDAVTGTLPLLGRWDVAYRLLLLALLSSALLATLLYYLEARLG